MEQEVRVATRPMSEARSGMAQAAKSQDPSMEEILASIRRIIAEDDSDKLAKRPAATGEIGAEGVASSLGAPRSLREPDPQETTSASNSAPNGTPNASHSSTILNLTEVASPAARTPAFDQTPAPVQPAPIEDPDTVPEGQTGAAPENERGQLVSSATSAAVDSAFNALAQTVLVHNARTLEDLVREMLRPMLKVWLDDNLPGMVERLVRAEIERVSRGR
jgi:cell pole-organizing protein PopZ